MSSIKENFTKVFECKNLSIGYKTNNRSVKIVKDKIKFSAKKNELIAVLGSNGIGKSTFLRTITGLQDKIAGDFFIFNKNFSSLLRKEIAKNVSFVSTQVINVPNMLVYELVALGRYPHTNWIGKVTETDDKFIAEALELVGMSDLKNRFVNELSDGERRRVMIARTLAQDTQIIILDEPTAYLDLAHKYLLIKTLKELCEKKNKTIIFSTHDLHIALKTADKIWLFLSDSLHEGAPEDLIFDESIKRIFPNNELFFNENTLDFDIKKEKPVKISLNGEKRVHELTQKALERIGFEISAKAKNKILIKPEENKTLWVYNSVNEFLSIYELIEFLKLKHYHISSNEKAL